MIGCLAILIPSRFGASGLQLYGRTSLNLAIVEFLKTLQIGTQVAP